ncbi:MFS transporter [Pseudomonas sp. CCM 7891]|uniref:MFS transporter n=1 Tax=Pseudomonas karstica TaxID=1055468 RepID=A0A7X2RQV8_9PSED|nr:MFS transporter [Pseudomonas karstica]MTD19358.1 MFS transporter [Pseudomonas karstica]
MPNTPDANLTPRQIAVLVVILCSYLMIVLDISIVITALPRIRQTFEMSTAGLSWVQNAYTLAFGGLLLLGARAGDILGRRRMFLVGLGIFTVASLLVALAQSASLLLAARALQGIGAAVLAPSTLALLLTNFTEGNQRTRAIAYYGAAAGIGASVGLLLGGLLTEWLSWRVGFLINVPIGIALMLGARHYLSETARHAGKFDFAGAVLSTAGMTALVFGIVESTTLGWSDPVTLGTVVSGLVLLAVFVAHEARVNQPILPLRLFTHRIRAGAYAARMLFLGGMIGFWFFTTQYLQEVLGFSASEAGMAFLPTTLVNFAIALAVPRLTKRFGNAWLLAGGVAFALLGMIWLSAVTAHSNYLVDVALPMVLIGLGQGASLSPLTSAGMTDVESRDAGAASGLVNVAHQLGGSLGLGILTVVFAHGEASNVGAQAIASGVSAAFVGSSVMLGLALIFIVALIIKPATATSKQ